MSQYYIPSTSRALYRVFIAPTLTPAYPLRLQTPFLLPYYTTRLPSPPQTTVRHKTYKKDIQRHALSDHFTFDNAIQGTYINLVSDTGEYKQNVPLYEALRSYNRVTHHLLQLSSGEDEVDEEGYEIPGALPLCKVISKIDLRAQHTKKLEIMRRTLMGKGAGPDAKNLELNWAIAGGDLGHRLEKLKGFLKDGRKVEVLIGPKIRGRVATEEECRDLLLQVRGTVEELSGAREIKKPDGVIGGVMTLFFEGKNLGESTSPEKKPKGEAKKERKEREEKKAERRKAAEEDRRNKLKDGMANV
ncbi:hypothetical protein P280DRAFT_466569 [Massarina eburnea CBS 473.64]|uniref:Translation initiation factor 3 N-terminal domain-containing protein n=1 Tax=Massarina eburnea CBS 473.64 TaxID=1395130 RepID=A0A6A6S7X9_9PLEO|nr:hypothetical protein P280DRAFT_466569 [Massarina eburnea CBS 473.64]